MQGPIEYSPRRTFLVVYPLIPWIGVMAAGYAFSPVLGREQRSRSRTLYAAGFGLGVVYLVWAGVVLALYLPCRWFAKVKRERKEAWLGYL